MNAEDLEILWDNPAHWSVWCYACAKDPRIIVPKRNPAWGWTINAAHPKAIVALLEMFLLSVLFPLAVVVMEGVTFDPLHLALATLLSCVVTVSLCKYLAKYPYKR